MSSTVIVDELAQVVADLQGVGIPATTDPAQVWALAARSDVVVLLGWPEDVALSFGANQLRFVIPARLASRGPDLHAQPRLLGALPAVLRVLRPARPASPDRVTAADVEMPAYLIESPRQVGCPTS